ncbi:MAG: hypothetical protein BWK79_06990 [Beggiatoa sp. IS2]|nr:MAG: hypothetical protein BWK79_06990 [Beggiatoa sp. IS2]
MSLVQAVTSQLETRLVSANPITVLAKAGKTAHNSVTRTLQSLVDGSTTEVNQPILPYTAVVQNSLATEISAMQLHKGTHRTAVAIIRRA